MSVQKFKKKPVEVEAIQFLGTVESAQEILVWANSNDIRGLLSGAQVALEINNAGVVELVAQGEWVISISPDAHHLDVVSSDYFEAFYDLVEENTDD